MREQGLLREEWPIVGPQGPEIRVEGRAETVLNFCANNYLGLSGHPELVAAAHRTLDTWGYGMSSVRFICGTQRLHLDLERRIADFLGMDDAITYAACFDANGGVFEPLLGAETRSSPIASTTPPSSTASACARPSASSTNTRTWATSRAS
jgi:glycine C-acetyltransferase